MSFRTRYTRARIFLRCLRIVWAQVPPAARRRLILAAIVRAAGYAAWTGFAFGVIVFCGWLWLALSR